MAWWRHQMETFSASLTICARNSPVPGEFPAQSPVTRSFVHFELRPNQRLSKQSWCWWFETPSRPLWRHRNGVRCFDKRSLVTQCRSQMNVLHTIPQRSVRHWVTPLTTFAINPDKRRSHILSVRRLRQALYHKIFTSSATTNTVITIPFPFMNTFYLI